MRDDRIWHRSSQVRNLPSTLLIYAPEAVAAHAGAGYTTKERRSGASACIIGLLRAGRTDDDAAAIGSFKLMADKFFLFLSHVLVVTFFAGLVGCAFMIFLSWVDIFSDSFTEDD